MRLLHLSDLRIGLGFPDLPQLADELRAARMTALRSALVHAQSEGVEAVLLAGNTLADLRVLTSEVQELAAILCQAPVPILLLPGQTDPASPAGPYRLRPEAFGPRTRILAEGDRIAVGNGWVCTAPTGAVPTPAPPAPAGPRVGVACFDPGSGSAQRLQDLRTRLSPVEALAMGGASVRQQLGDASWPGTAEAFDWGHERGQALLLDLPPGRPARATPVEIGRFRWQRVEVALGPVEAVVAALSAVSDPGDSIVRLELSGRVPPPRLAELLRALDAWRDRFHALDLDDRIEVVAEADSPVRTQLLASLRRRLFSDVSAARPEAARAAVTWLDRLLAGPHPEDLV